VVSHGVTFAAQGYSHRAFAAAAHSPRIRRAGLKPPRSFATPAEAGYISAELPRIRRAFAARG